MRRLVRPRNRRRLTGRGAGGTAEMLVRAGLAPALALGLIVTLGPWLCHRIAAHPYFAVDDIGVRGTHRLSVEAVRTAVGIEPGTSIWGVDVRAAESRLAALPWVRSVHVRTELPRRVTVRIREQRPAAILALGEPGTLWYVTRRGALVAPLAPDDSHDFPYVTGLAAADFAADATTGPRALRGALALARAAARHEQRLPPVSEVHVDGGRGLVLLLVRPAVPIEVGWDDFDDKLARLPGVLAQWAGRESELAAMSVVFDDEVIVRTRAPAPHTAAPSRRPNSRSRA